MAPSSAFESDSGIRDNHTRGSKLSIVSAYFTIYAYETLKEHLDQIEHMDFLFGELTFVKSLDPDKTEKKEFIIHADGLKLANTLQQKRVAKECAEWIRRKVDIKSVKQTIFPHGDPWHTRHAKGDATLN